MSEGVEFAIGAKRIAPLWRLVARIKESDWTAAIDMDGAQVAVADYRPDWWPSDTWLLIRRIRLDISQVSADSRSRRRATCTQTSARCRYRQADLNGATHGDPGSDLARPGPARIHARWTSDSSGTAASTASRTASSTPAEEHPLIDSRTDATPWPIPTSSIGDPRGIDRLARRDAGAIVHRSLAAW
ncbi:MAG: hypothetical protein ACRDS0_35215 [Pseudonocardiaceae bacterium]